MERFDLVVIGGGLGGCSAAERAAGLGIRTALIEEERIGGTCLHLGCIPAKAMIHVAETARLAREGESVGVCAKSVTLDYGKALCYRDGVIEGLERGLADKLRGTGVAVFSGRGTVLPGMRVSVAGKGGEAEMLEAGRILLATGSRPLIPPVLGADLPGVMDSDGFFALRELPDSVIIIGGGAVGVELAEALADLGARVSVIESARRLLPGMGREISQSVRMAMRGRGIAVHEGARLDEIRMSGGNLSCIFSEKNADAAEEARAVIFATGRKPNIEGLFAVECPATSSDGLLEVDENFETSVPKVYAIGDIVPGPHLAHAASHQGRAVAERLAGMEPLAGLSLIPRCVYASPEIATVGIGEDEAKSLGVSCRVGKSLTAASGMSAIRRSGRGFVKVLAEEGTGIIIGAELMCDHATDMIGEFAVAVANRMTARQMLRAVRPHPTLEETAGDALFALLP